MANLKPQQLILELTETALIQDLSAVSEKLKILTDYGLYISIDDFGTAYSSMINLYRLPINELKIDRIFTLEMGKNHKARGIVESLVTLSKRMQITTVAEGVETAEQEEFLREIGCDLMQGYYFAKPLAPEDWLKYLASANSTVGHPVN
ncbi:MAG: EAL domain-containing protein [Alteromonas oceani]